MSMTDLSSSNGLKNNCTEGEWKKNSAPLHSYEVLGRNVTARTKGNKDATDRNSHSDAKENELSNPPKTNVCTSISSENLNCFDDFFTASSDELSMVTNASSSAPGDSFKWHTAGDELEKSHCANKTISSSAIQNCNVDKQVVSSSSKSKNSSGFSMFGQLLNRRQPNCPTSRNSGSANKYCVLTDLRESLPSDLPRNEVSETSNGMQRPQMKTKLRSMWNNVKYGWRIRREVNLKTDSAIWLLGQCYHNKLNDDITVNEDVAEQLRLDLLSKIWLTYRINFPAIPGTNLMSDSGWGCMLRCGQMMMAQAFICHFLRRDWRLHHQSTSENQLYKTILRWFGDSLSQKSPFSLHHLVSLGENYGRKAGDWYGPTHAAHVLRDALCEAQKHEPHLQQLCMHVALDGIVFKEDIMDLCLNSKLLEKTDGSTSLTSDSVPASKLENKANTSSLIGNNSCSPDFFQLSENVGEEEPKSMETPCPSYSEFGPPSYSTVKPQWKSLILFVSVRLGNDKINPFYIPCLKSLLAYEHCIGIIGGRPKHALYFIGWQDDKIIHMDPHSCQPAVDVEKEDFNEKSFHSSSVRTLSFSEMDPSCSIGFYFRELQDFQIFVEKFSEITAPLKRNLEYPVFALADGKRNEVDDDVYHTDGKSIYPRYSDQYADEGDGDNDYILL